MTGQSGSARRGLSFIIMGIAILGGLVFFFLDQETEVPADPVSMPPLPVLIVVGALVVVGVFFFVVRAAVAMSIRRTLDQAFGLMGLQPSNPALGLRSYQGEYNGFRVDVSLLPGPAIHVQVWGQLGSPARIRLGPGGEIAFADAETAHLSASSPDQAWVRALLADADSREAILGLLGAAGAQGGRSLLLHGRAVGALPRRRASHRSGARVAPPRSRWLIARSHFPIIWA